MKLSEDNASLIYEKNIFRTKKSSIIYKLNYICGLFSLFFIPKYSIFNLANFSLIISVFIIFFIFILSISEIKINSKHIYFFIFSSIFIFVSIIGSFNTKAVSDSILSSINFTITLFFVFFSYNLNRNSSLGFYKGFIDSSLITSVWIIIDFFFYQKYHISINEIVIPKNLLDIDHTITFNFEFNSILLYKPAGFSWDPGMSVTAIVLAFVFIDQKIINITKENYVKLLMFNAIMLSLSLTSIISLFAYLIIKNIVNRRYLKILSLKISSISIIAIFTFLTLFFISYQTRIEKATTALEGGKLTHLKYLSGIMDYPKLPFEKFLFGFGYRGVGEFYNKYVKWFTGYFDKGANPESTLTNIFFIGGIIGTLYFVTSYIICFRNLNIRYKYVLFLILILSFGYGINSTWFNVILLYLFIEGYNNKLNIPHT
jgi:hypothetical protein